MGDGDEPKATKPKRRRPGWFWRLVRSFCLLLFLLLALLGGGLYWATHHLVEIVDYIGERFFPVVQVGVKDLQFQGRTLEASGVVVSLPSEGRPVAVLREVKADWTWSWEAGFHVESIVVNGMRVRLRPSDFAKLQGTPHDAPAASTPPGAPGWLEQQLGHALDWRLDSLEVKNGSFVIEPGAAMALHGDFELELQEVDAALGGTQPQKFQLEEVVMEIAGDPVAKLAKADLEASFVDLRVRRLASLRSSGLSIELQSDRMERWPQGEKTAPTGDTKETPWEIEQFELRKGSITYRQVLEDVADLVVSTQFELPSTRLNWPGDAKDPAMKWELAKLQVLEEGQPAPRIEVQKGSLEAQLSRLRESRTFDAVRLLQGDVRIDPQLGEWLAAWPKGESGSGGDSSGEAWLLRLDLLDVEAIRIVLRDLDPDLPTLSFPFQTSLKDLQWPPRKESVLTEAQVLEFGPLVVTSPLDPLTPVMRFPTIFVKFTPAELLRQHLQEVKILYPTIFVGRDLFWYIDVVQKRQGTAPADGSSDPDEEEAGASWRVDKFVTEQGKLMLVTGRGRQIPLPIPFSAEVNGIDFASLAELQLQLDLQVPEADYRFPDYQLAFLDLSGAIDFSLPPGSDADNLVNKLTTREIQFRQFEATQAWLSVTFDLEGTHGEFGGRAYSGYLNGGFTIAMEGPQGWSGWVSGTGVDLDAITRILVPENLLWSGKANFSLTTKGFRQEVQELKGELKGEGSGTFTITKLDEMLKRIPEDWSPLRRSIMELGLVTVRDFAYESARGRFDYQERAGSLRLELEAPETRRLLEIELHPPGAEPPPPTP